MLKQREIDFLQQRIRSLSEDEKSKVLKIEIKFEHLHNDFCIISQATFWIIQGSDFNLS